MLCYVMLCYRLIRLGHYCSVPDAKPQCTEIGGSHPYIQYVYRMLDNRSFSKYHSRIDFKNQMFRGVLIEAPSTEGQIQ